MSTIAQLQAQLADERVRVQLLLDAGQAVLAFHAPREDKLTTPLADLKRAIALVRGHGGYAEDPRAAYLSAMEAKGEHVLASDCWCNPVVHRICVHHYEMVQGGMQCVKCQHVLGAEG